MTFVSCALGWLHFLRTRSYARRDTPLNVMRQKLRYLPGSGVSTYRITADYTSGSWNFVGMETSITGTPFQSQHILSTRTLTQPVVQGYERLWSSSHSVKTFKKKWQEVVFFFCFFEANCSLSGKKLCIYNFQTSTQLWRPSRSVKLANTVVTCWIQCLHKSCNCIHQTCLLLSSLNLFFLSTYVGCNLLLSWHSNREPSLLSEKGYLLPTQAGNR